MDNDFDEDETITLPLVPLLAYGLEYRRMTDKEFGLHVALGVVWEGISIRRRIDNSRRTRSRSDLNASFRAGVFKNYKSFRIATGVHFRFIPGGNSFSNRFDNNINNGERVSLVAGMEYFESFNVHSSIYLNVDYKLFTTGRSVIRLNFIGNIGLYPIYITTSLIENFIENETKRIIHNNYGTYLGIGVKLVRSTDDKFKEIFNFQWE